MECGSVAECIHDGQAPPLVSDYHSSDSEEEGGDGDDAVEMVANAAILPAQEVFNTYGESLSDDELLVNYGFRLSP
jgi:SET domain-containing protein 6